MGAYLSEPITKKISSDENGTSVAFGASSMQGWRVSQEDAHNCCINFDDDTSLFAVYDGHGGHEVATYCAKELPRFIKNTESYKTGNIGQALIDAFLGFDATLAKPNIIALLKEIAGSNENEKDKSGYRYSDEEENISDLRMEATMPLEQVIARYRCSEMTDFQIKDVNKDTNEKETSSSSPYSRCRRSREKSIGSAAGQCSTEPGCSSSSSWWNNDCEDASSSTQQPCSSSSFLADADDDVRPCAPNRDKNLGTTTSNGSIDSKESQVDTTPTNESTDDTPDCCEDIKGRQIESNRRNSHLTDDTDSIQSFGDNVSSSSLAGPLENGQIQQNPTALRRITPTRIVDTHLYQNLLRKGTCKQINRREKCNFPIQDKQHPDDNSDDDDEEDEDDDDEENDETFDGLHASSDDDIQDLEDSNDNHNNSSSSSSSMSNSSGSSSENVENDSAKNEHGLEDNEEEDEDDGGVEDDGDDDDDDEDDDGGDFTMNMTEEPGSDSGCTAVVAILHSRDLYVANAGDSRCVLCRDGQALELSLDHKPEDEPEMERIIKAGGKVTSDGRVNGGLNLSRALGDHAYKQNTTLTAQEQMISALPDIRHIAIEPERDEFMILACDGIWNFMSSQEVVSFVRPRLANLKQSNISTICEELFDHCLAPDTHGDGTGCDNMTAVIVKFNWHDDATDSSGNRLPNIISGKASLSKKRSISPANTTDIDPTTDDGPTSFSNDNIAEKHNFSDRECTTTASNNDSKIKDSCKRLKTETKTEN